MGNMTILYSLVASSLVVGTLNLVAVLFLSNALFRILMVPKRPIPGEPKSEEKGLVDIRQTMTYDPRFSSKNAN